MKQLNNQQLQNVSGASGRRIDPKWLTQEHWQPFVNRVHGKGDGAKTSNWAAGIEELQRHRDSVAKDVETLRTGLNGAWCDAAVGKWRQFL